MRGISIPWSITASAGVLAGCRLVMQITLRVSGEGKVDENIKRRCAKVCKVAQCPIEPQVKRCFIETSSIRCLIRTISYSLIGGKFVRLRITQCGKG